MSIVKAISSTNAFANLKYLVDTPAHDESLTSHRSLKFYGRNVDTDYQGRVNSAYLGMQFRAVREQARNPNKRVQAQHLIFSFGSDEFAPDQQSLGQQAKQAGQLVAGYISQRLPKDSQYLIAVQCDSKGHNLHAHVVVNSVLLSGKVLNTNLISVTKADGLRAGFDKYMSDYYPKLTGKEWTPVQPQDKVNRVHSTAQQIEERGGYVWREDLKGRLIQAMQETDNLQDYVAVLETLGVTVKTRRASVGKDENGHKIYRQAYTYTMVGEDSQTHASRDFARTKHGGTKGLGQMFTPDAITDYYKSRPVEQVPTRDTGAPAPLKQSAVDDTQLHRPVMIDEEEDYNANTQGQPIDGQAGGQDDLREAIKAINYDAIDTSTSERITADRQARQAQRQRQQRQRKRQQRIRAEQASAPRPATSAPSHSQQPASHPRPARDTGGSDLAR